MNINHLFYNEIKQRVDRMRTIDTVRNQTLDDVLSIVYQVLITREYAQTTSTKGRRYSKKAYSNIRLWLGSKRNRVEEDKEIKSDPRRSVEYFNRLFNKARLTVGEKDA